MSLVYFLYQNSIRLFLLSVFFIICNGVAGTLLVIMIGKVATNYKISTQPTIAILFLLLCLIIFSTKSLAEICLLKLTQKKVYDLRNLLSKKTLKTPYKDIKTISSEKIYSILTKDIDTFTQCFMIIPSVLANIILIALSLLYILLLSPVVFIILTISLSIGLSIFKITENKNIIKLTELREQMDILYNSFRNLLNGVRELKINSYKRNNYLTNVIEKNSKKIMNDHIKVMKIYTLILSYGVTFYFITIGVILFTTPMYSNISQKNIIIVTFILLYLGRPLNDIMSSLPHLNQAIIALNKMLLLNKNLSSNKLCKKLTNPFTKKEGITIKIENLLYYYNNNNDDQNFKIGPLNLKIKQGELIFIIGGNGSGKTTLAMLLTGLLDANSGNIKFNDIIINNENIEYYYQFFSVIFSDFHLFEDILYIADGMEEKIDQYTKTLRIDHKVKIVNKKFSTTNLSTGQRKRLALIAAYLEDKPIYIFDEWAADQDPIFKKFFYEKLLPDFKNNGKTIIIISHDESYFKIADRIIKLNNGNFEEIFSF